MYFSLLSLLWSNDISLVEHMSLSLQARALCLDLSLKTKGMEGGRKNETGGFPWARNSFFLRQLWKHRRILEESRYTL